MARTGAKVIRFGVFEVDLAARELRKRGVRVKLQEQPFRLLQTLLERPGEIIEREEIQAKLWPDDTFVDFDKSLNTAAQKLRQALSDSAETPRFVETVPRRGYRFVAPVERAAPAASRAYPSWAVPALVIPAVVVGGAWLWGSGVGERPAPSLPKHVLRQLTYESGVARDPAISPDGTLLAYASDRAGEGHFDIWVRQIGGGDPIRLTDNPAQDLTPSFSPDGRLVVFYSSRNGGGVYVVPAFGGDARFIVGGAAQEPRFSPDGRHIAYSNYGPFERVWLAPAEGGPATEVHPDPPGNRRSLILSPPVWLPDGRILTGGHGTNNWTILSHGGDEPAVRTDVSESWLQERGFARLLGAAASELYLHRPGAWWASQRRVILTATHGGSTNLWTIPLSLETGRATGEPERLTVGAGPDLSPSISESGRIVFNDLSADLDVVSLPVEADTGKVVGDLEALITGEAKHEFPVLSADGKKLAYVSNRSGAGEVWIEDLATREPRRITFSGQMHWQGGLAFRRDGSELAYAIPGDSIYVTWVAGGRSRRVGDYRGVRDWMPGTQRLVLGGSRILDLDQGEAGRLAADRLHDARVSPDGEWLAFHWFAKPNRRQVFVTPIHEDRPAGEDERIRITDGAFNEYRAAWSPDANLLYFNSDRDGYACIWAQRLDPETKQPVGDAFEVYGFHHASLALAGRSHGFWLSVGPDRLVFNIARTRGNIWMLDPVEEEE